MRDCAPCRDAVHVAPVLAPRVRQFALALDEAARLQALVSGYVYSSVARLERFCSWADAALGSRLVPLLRTRSLDHVSAQRCRRTVVPSLVAYVCPKLPFGRAYRTRSEDYIFSAIDRVAARRYIDARTALVLGREDGCLASFRRARQVGATTVYDLPIAHYQTVREILEREEAEFPGIGTAPGTRALFAADRIEHKEEELRAADPVAVASAFV